MEILLATSVDDFVIPTEGKDMAFSYIDSMELAKNVIKKYQFDYIFLFADLVNYNVAKKYMHLSNVYYVSDRQNNSHYITPSNVANVIHGRYSPTASPPVVRDFFDKKIKE